MRNKIIATVLIALVVCGLILTVFPALAKKSDNRITFPVNIKILAPKGTPEKYARIFIYSLTEDGSELVMTLSAEGGRATTCLTVEKRQFVYFDEPLRSVIATSKVYVTLNFRIVVFGTEGSGGYALPIDPAEIEENGGKDVTIQELPYFREVTYSEQMLGTLSTPVLEELDETYKTTKIHTFHSWDNLESRFDADSGSKISLKKRWRQWIRPPEGEIRLSHDWADLSGYVVVTVDAGRHYPISGYLSGSHRYDVYFELKYRYERWRTSFYGGQTVWDEYSFVLDTDSDPRGFLVETKSPLSGNGEDDPWNHGHAYWNGQGALIDVPVHGHTGESLRFSVSVGFGVQWPKPGIGVSVSISVWKEYQSPSPMYVHVAVGTHPNPTDVGWTYDRNTDWMRLYLTWATTRP